MFLVAWQIVTTQLIYWLLFFGKGDLETVEGSWPNYSADLSE